MDMAVLLRCVACAIFALHETLALEELSSRRQHDREDQPLSALAMLLTYEERRATAFVAPLAGRISSRLISVTPGSRANAFMDMGLMDPVTISDPGSGEAIISLPVIAVIFLAIFAPLSTAVGLWRRARLVGAFLDGKFDDIASGEAALAEIYGKDFGYGLETSETGRKPEEIQADVRGLPLPKDVKNMITERIANRRDFNDLSTFYRLRVTNRPEMLQHSSDPISESLTQLSGKLASSSVKLFGNLLRSMGDQPATSNADEQKLIIEAVLDIPLLRDEIYVQVMKQLTSNPSPSSAIKGWQMMVLLCRELPPSEELCGYLRAFLQRASMPPREEDLKPKAGAAKSSRSKEEKKRAAVEARKMSYMFGPEADAPAMFRPAGAGESKTKSENEERDLLLKQPAMAKEALELFEFSLLRWRMMEQKHGDSERIDTKGAAELWFKDELPLLFGLDDSEELPSSLQEDGQLEIIDTMCQEASDEAARAKLNTWLLKAGSHRASAAKKLEFVDEVVSMVRKVREAKSGD